MDTWYTILFEASSMQELKEIIYDCDKSTACLLNHLSEECFFRDLGDLFESIEVSNYQEEPGHKEFLRLLDDKGKWFFYSGEDQDEEKIFYAILQLD